MRDSEGGVMAQRTVTDDWGRQWTCDSIAAPAKAGEATRPMGLDVRLSCTTTSVASPVSVTVGWGWETIAEKGLARMIALASPAPKQ
jgi:hypothetical protein